MTDHCNGKASAELRILWQLVFKIMQMFRISIVFSNLSYCVVAMFLQKLNLMVKKIAVLKSSFCHFFYLECLGWISKRLKVLRDTIYHSTLYFREVF